MNPDEAKNESTEALQQPGTESLGGILGALGLADTLGPALVGLLGRIGGSGNRRRFIKAMLLIDAKELTEDADALEDEGEKRRKKQLAARLIAYAEILQESD